MGDLLEQYPCSPRKIRRLEFGSQNTEACTPEGKKKVSQESQQSRPTSTPTKRSREENLSISVDLSSIHAPSEKSVVSELFQDAGSVSSARSLLEELSLMETPLSYISSPPPESVDLLRAPNRKLFKGKLWKFFEPKIEGSLYFKIFTDFDGIEEYAFDLLNEFQTNKQKATLALIKFFIDICGYQRAEVEEYFDFSKDFNISSEKVIKLMEVDLVDQELLDNKTYIFYECEKDKSKLGATLAMAIQRFMENFIFGADTLQLLFSDALYKYVFNFLFYMCLSILRPIRHTGIVLVRMLLTILNSIYERTLKNLHLEANSEDDNDDLSAEKKLEYIERYLNYFFRLFAKNSFIPDPHLAVLRVWNVKQMGIWAIDYPKIYFQKCFELLLKLLLDESEAVRLSTLEVFENFLKKKSTTLYITKNINNMIKMVSDRFKDVSTKVVAKAVNLFTVLLDNYRQFLGDDICEISNLLYGNSYLYAKAAGAFLSKYFTYAYTNPTQIIRKLVELSALPRFCKMKPLLVEGFSECETVLKNYEFLVDYLLTSCQDEHPEFVNNLMELIYYSVYQTLKGESPLKRKHSIQAFPLPSHHENISNMFLLNLKSLFELYQTKTIALIYLIKILCLIDFDVLTSSNHGNFLFMMKNCRHFLLKMDDEELLENICNLFSCLCFDKNISMKENIKNKFLDNLFGSMSGYLKKYLEHEDQEKIPLDVHFKKIGKLYEKFNLNTYFHWNDLFVMWDEILLCEGQIICCAQFLIWKTEELATEMDKVSDAFRIKSLNFKHIFSIFTNSLVSVMLSADSESDLKLKAFCNLCNLYASSDRTLLKEQELNGLRFNILEILRKGPLKTITQFFKKMIVYNRLLSLETRKKYISYWSNLILNGIIDVLYIIPLFECYYTRGREYETLIEFVANKIFVTNPKAFFNIILVTLGELTEELFETEKKLISSPDGVELTKLAAKFSNMKQFRQFSEEVLRLIHLGISFAFKEELLEFFVLLQNFTPRLISDRKRCLDILQKGTPAEHENNNYVKAFRMKLKLEKIDGGRKSSIGEKTLDSNISISKEEFEENIEPTLKRQKLYSISKDRSKQLAKDAEAKKASGKKKQLTSQNDDNKENLPTKPKSQKKKGGKSENIEKATTSEDTEAKKASTKKKQNDDDKENLPTKPKSQKKKGRRSEDIEKATTSKDSKPKNKK